MMAEKENPSFVVRPHEDVVRGHGAFARPGGIKAGQVVLSEPPLLLYPQASVAHLFCGHCLRYLEQSSPTSCACPSCRQPRQPRQPRQTRFCGEACRAAAASDPASHSPMACALMQVARVEDATDETVSAMLFLSRLCALLLSARAGDAGALRRYEAFLSLSDGNRDIILEDREYAGWLEEVCHRFAPCLAEINQINQINQIDEINQIDQIDEIDENEHVGEEFVKMACLKDLVNSYGIRVPAALGADCGVLRGTALYEEASRFNHECLPNVARCDDFDQSTSMKFIALHDLPEGEEITQSYFPLDWGVSDRQTRCRTVYGFTCTCPRCVMDERTVMDSVMDDDGMMDLDGYIAVFLLKYLCVDAACEGTMVPLRPLMVSEMVSDGDGDDGRNDGRNLIDGTHACNVCGRVRTEAEFLRGLESGGDGGD